MSNLAIDCEMVETSEGLALARVTAVDVDLNVILDMLVKPSLPIRNYLTEYVLMCVLFSSEISN